MPLECLDESHDLFLLASLAWECESEDTMGQPKDDEMCSNRGYPSASLPEKHKDCKKRTALISIL